MPSFPWKQFLQTLSRDVIVSREFEDLLSEETTAIGWLGDAGATEEEIATAEKRLGVAFPPSYRTFLSVTNGWRVVTTFVTKLWSTSEVCWHRDHHSEGIEAWIEADSGDGISDEEYRVYGGDVDQPFRSKYLRSALEVSEWGDGVFLLNPEIVTDDGEWEAWFHAPWILGARRYRSFWDLMYGEHHQFIDLMKYERGEPTPRVDPLLGVEATDLEGLIAALDRADIKERKWALDSLANLRNRRAVEPVLAIYENADDDPDVRCAAARTLADLRDERAIDPLIQHLREYARIWFQRIEPKGLNRSCADEQVVGLRHATRQGLLGMGDLVIPRLLEATVDSDPIFRAEVVDLLCYARGHNGVFERLSEMLSDPDTRVRRVLVSSIEQLVDERWIDLLFPRALDDPSPEVRVEAVRVLSRAVFDDKIIQRIEELAVGDTSKVVRDIAHDSLAERQRLRSPNPPSD